MWLNSRSFSAFENERKTSFSWNIILNKSLLLEKWKGELSVKLKHDLIRSLSLNSQLLWTSLILMPPVLWPWRSPNRLWVVVQEHPSPRVFGKQRIRPGHSICCHSSDEGPVDLQSPRSDKKWTAVFHRSCRQMLRSRRNRINHMYTSNC